MRTPEQQRAIEQWKHDNRGAIAKLPRQLNVASSIVQDVIAGKRTTVTLQVECQLAALGCPGFEQYKQKQQEMN